MRPAAEPFDRRDSWSRNAGHISSPGLGEPSKAPPSQAGARFFRAVGRLVRTLVVLGALGAAGWYGWQHGRPLWSKMRLNSEVETAASLFLKQVPTASPRDADLAKSVALAAEDKLRTYLSRKGRWFVAYGPSADALTVHRDDHFAALDRTFADTAVTAALRRAAAPGTDVETLDYPRGVLTRTVTVGGATWVVVAAWTEDGT